MRDKIAEMIGPEISGHQVIVEGRAIPGLTMREEGSEICFVLDGRLSINVPRDFAIPVAWFVANALAIGQGFSHIGGESKDRPFAPQVMNLSDSDSGPTH